MISQVRLVPVAASAGCLRLAPLGSQRHCTFRIRYWDCSPTLARGVLWLMMIGFALLGESASGQEIGGVVALTQLRESRVAQALDALGPAADGRSHIPEVETDGALPAAAGGMYRALMQLDAEERFDLLSKWTLPNEERQHVRLLTTLVPQAAPPAVFARVLGERPRETSFMVAEIQGIRGLFSSGWMLVTAAEETGRLRGLITELEALVAKQSAGADTLLLLARIADAQADVEALKASLTQRAAPLQVPPPNAAEATNSVNADALMIAAAALKHPELRALSEGMWNALVESTLGRESPRLRPFLRIAQATAIQLHRGESGPEALHEQRLKYWLPVSGITSVTSAEGAVGAMWLTHEDHILHVAGSGQDALLFRYPLAGDFNFQCETQEGGRIGTDGGLRFGGLMFEALGSTNSLTVTDADGAHVLQRYCPFVRHESQPVFNRVSIRTRPAAENQPSAAQFLSNLHPMWTDELSGSSPWLGLGARGETRPMFRNLQFEGDPVIPREVALTSGRQLRGWLSNFYGESQGAFHAGGSLSLTAGTISIDTDGPASPPSEPQPDGGVPVVDSDWQLADGLLTAARRDAVAGRTSQSVLRYQRPLLDGESISYEFEYQPGSLEVHPALGRLAFLVAADGVRIHWLTDGDREWTGLPEDNATLEPLNRRGGREIPLRAGDWNAVTLSRLDDKVTISLNGTLIYERAIDFAGDLQFGLFRDRTQHAVRVRNVVLSGDWPMTLPEDCRKNPALVIGEEQAAADQRAQNATWGEDFLAENVAAVRATAARLTDSAERLDFLSRWILPHAGRQAFRLSGQFSQVDPPSPSMLKAMVQPDGVSETAPDRDVDEHFGGSWGVPSELVSPVFDWLDLANQLGRLDVLRSQVEAVAESDDFQRNRERAALLALICLESGDRAAAGQLAQKLFAYLPKEVPESLATMWPETLLVWRGTRRYGPLESVGEILSSIFLQRTQRELPTGIVFWHTQIAGLKQRHDHLARGGTNATFDAQLELDQWVPMLRFRSKSRGLGAGEARWLRVGEDELLHVSGHQEEFLLHRSPLTGDFEVTCEIGSYGTTQILAGGYVLGPSADLSLLKKGTYRRGIFTHEPLQQPLTRPDQWSRYRATYRDGFCTVSLNGQPVSSWPLTAQGDPWFGVRSWYGSNATFRDVRIAGTPVVPEEVLISGSELLDGWITYYEQTIGSPSANWSYELPATAQSNENGVDPVPGSRFHAAGIINGRHDPKLAGTAYESLLNYQRPLFEDGEIAYEFYYEPGRFETHPALDRVAFLLKPDGVKLHWITDGQFDPSHVSPENEFGSTTPAVALDGLLKPDSWNRAVLKITGGTVTIVINSEPVFEYHLEPTNRRIFGLFHFAGESQVRVRNVTLRGDWPKSIPAFAEQELADQTVPRLDAERDQLPNVFEHEFVDASLPEQLFKFYDPKGGAEVEHSPQGIRVTRPAGNAWTRSDVIAQFIMRGDFDVEAEFEDFRYQGTDDAVAMLVVKLADAAQHHARAMRGRSHHEGRQTFQVAKSLVERDGQRRYLGQTYSCEAHTGRLRLARRGDVVSYLLAEGDSLNYRLFGRETISSAETVDGIELQTIANGNATVSVVWKTVRIAAEELLLLPDPNRQPKNEIFVMNVDGSGLRSVTGEIGGEYGVGSPDWSPDGNQIAFDRYTGNSSSSHSFRINVDGTGLVDLGEGIMPTFSPDGKQLAFTWGGHGMALMDLNGKNRQVLSSEGWGAQFSPDGKSIAYQTNQEINGAYVPNITVLNIQTKEQRVLLPPVRASRYSQIYWNMEWSPDSRWIGFKAGLRSQTGRYESAITSAVSSAGEFRILTTETTDNDFGWHPDGTRILIAKNSPRHGGLRLFVYDLKTGDFDLLQSQPLDMPNHSGIWSPDGQQIAFVSRRNPTPIPWNPADFTP